MEKARPKTIIGWREWISLPELGVKKIKAKVDTGARTSALHASDIKIIKKHGKKWAQFTFHPLQHNRKIVKTAAPLVEFRTIKSSTGHRQERPVILTTLELMGQEWPIEITLTNRDMMGFRMLIGRQSIKKNFLVNAGRSFLALKTRMAK